MVAFQVYAASTVSEKGDFIAQWIEKFLNFLAFFRILQVEFENLPNNCEYTPPHIHKHTR